MADTEEKVDLDDIRRRLLDLKSQLHHDLEIKEQQVSEDADDLDPERGGVSNHMADDANETSEQETMLGIQQRIEHQRDQVDAALARLDAGKYGTCANCSKAISPARLNARPSSILCIDCQQLEDKGLLR